jgi:UDP-N-acetylglucosamine:LPS N-acetylglucosamine transferase
MLRQFWRESRPDLVVSLVPNFNRALAESLAAELPGLRLLTVLTDIADYPPHFWLEPVAQHVVCGSEKAVEQALAMGHPRERICRVSGMILNPAFHDAAPPSAAERAKERAALGFDERPVGLALFGGHGSPKMLEIARRLPDRQLLMICGHSEKLAEQLRAMRRPAPMYVEGFTGEVPRYMQLADYFIGKPGPGSVSEALQMRLPAIVESNAWTLPQERYNTHWLREMGAGIAVGDMGGISRAVDELLAPENYGRFRAATERVRNRAVFEVVERIERLLQTH